MYIFYLYDQDVISVENTVFTRYTYVHTYMYISRELSTFAEEYTESSPVISLCARITR